MYIEKLTIHGFGCLNTELAFQPDRVNLIIADNEAGKSTLAAAILAAFYGLEYDRRKSNSPNPFHHLFSPWNGSRYALTIDFNHKNIPWRIDRDFNTGETTLIDRDSGKNLAGNYHLGRGKYSFGEEFFGLTCDQFIRSFYIRQDEIPLAAQSAALLADPIQRIVTASKGEATATLAQERLSRALKSYPPPWGGDPLTIEYILKQLGRELNECQNRLTELEANHVNTLIDINAIGDLDVRLERLFQEKGQLERSGDYAELTELRKLLSENEERRSRIKELESKLTELERFRSFPSYRSDELNSLLWAIQDAEQRIDVSQRRIDQIEGELVTLRAERRRLNHIPELTDADVESVKEAVHKVHDRFERVGAAEKSFIEREKEARGKYPDVNFDEVRNSLFNLTETERRFIAEYRANHTDLRIELNDAMDATIIAEKAVQKASAKKGGASSLAWVFALIGIAALLTAVFMVFATHGDWKSQVLGVAGIASLIFAGGAYLLSRGRTHPELARLEREWQQAVDNEDAIRSRLNQMENQLNQLAENSGHTSGPDLLDTYAAYSRMEMIYEPVIRHLDSVRQDHQDALEALKTKFEQLGIHIDPGSDPNVEFQRLLDDIATVVRLKNKMVDMSERKTIAEAERDELKCQITIRSQQVQSILKQAGIEGGNFSDNARAQFDEAFAQFNLMMETEREINELRQSIVSEAELELRRQRLETLTNRIGGGNPPDLTIGFEECRDRISAVTREIEAGLRKREELRVKIGAHYDRYQKEAPVLKAKCAQLIREIAKIETFREEIRTAYDILGQISEELYRTWAQTLSKDAAPVLTALNPRYSELRFADDLSFTVRDKVNDRILEADEVARSLSSGARDEIYLSVRIALTSFLTRGLSEALPILMDEPLAAVDDEKFLTGMRYFLMDLSQHHQIIILTCHNERHKWLREQMPDVYRDRIAEMAFTQRAVA